MMRWRRQCAAAIAAAAACVAVAVPTIQAGAAQGATPKKFPYPDTSLSPTGSVDLTPLVTSSPLAGREFHYASTPSGAVWVVTSRLNCGSGAIYECGTSSYLSRLNSNGQLQTWLGEGGSLGYTAVGNAGSKIVADAEGRAVTVTPEHGSEFTVRRFLSTGAPDTSFGGGGAVTVNCGCQAGSQEISIATDGDGGILVRTGSWLPGLTTPRETITRLNADGTLVSGFGIVGVMQGGTEIDNAFISPGGAVFLVDNSGSISPGVSLERFSNKGAPVQSYRTKADGALAQASRRVDLSQYTVAALRFRAHGVIDLIFEGSFEGAAVVRLRKDGSLETKFGNGGAKKLGKRILQVLPGAEGTTLALATPRSSETGQLQLASFRPDYTLDPAFGHNGSFDLELGEETGVTMTPATNGRVTVVDDGRRFCRYTVCGPEPKLYRYRVGKAK